MGRILFAVIFALSLLPSSAWAFTFSVPDKTLAHVTDPWIDVRAYGAICDGSTDDATAIQNAVNAGRRILFPPGYTCLVKSSISIPYNKGNIWITGYGAKLKGHADLSSGYIFDFTGTVANQNFNNLIEGFAEVDLNGAKGFIHFNKGVHTTRVQDIFIKDSTFATSANTVGIRILNSFNIVIDNVRIHKLNGTSGVGVQIVSDSGVEGFDNITSLHIKDCVFQRSWKNVDMNFDTGADTIKITNTALGDDSTPLGQYGLYVSGVVHQLSLDGNHIEHVPNGIYINASEYSGSLYNNTFYDVENAMSFAGAATGADISMAANRFLGTAQAPKYELFAVNNAAVTLLDRLRFSSTTYTEAIGSGTGTIRNNSKVTAAKTSSHTVLDVEESRTFTNNGAGGAVTFTLPACSAVGDGFEVSFVVVASQLLYIDPNGTDKIVPLTDADGDRISNSTSGSTITLVSRSTGGASRWYVLSSEGTWADAN
jgi:hypothetical protein